MVDADAPSAKAAKCRYWLHWATSDVDGRHLRNGVNWMNGEGKIIKGKIMISLVKQDLNSAKSFIKIIFTSKSNKIYIIVVNIKHLLLIVFKFPKTLKYTT